jgi:polyisoprenoid-binding protein YceI
MHGSLLFEYKKTRMKFRFGFTALLLLMIQSLQGQTYVSEKSTVGFFSQAAIEDIKAQNTKGSALFNSSTGEIAFMIPISEFQFAKSLMKEHFNEKYLESDRYPRATFQGKVEGFDPGSSGEQQVTTTGKLTIHGVTNEVSIPGTITGGENKLTLRSRFVIRLADYKIAIPQLLWQNIAEQVEVTINYVMKPK